MPEPTDPAGANAAECVQAKLAEEGATWLRARLRIVDEINANPDPDDDCPPTHVNAAIRLKPLPDGWMSVYGPEHDVNPDRLQALLDERVELLADRARLAAELEQARGERVHLLRWLDELGYDAPWVKRQLQRAETTATRPADGGDAA
jgi:hypothetical protein